MLASLLGVMEDTIREYSLASPGKGLYMDVSMSLKVEMVS